MATAKKTAPAAKKVAAAPAPAPAAQEEEGTALEVGMMVQFNGYGEGVDDADKVLEEGSQHEIVGFTQPDPANGHEGGDPVVRIPNPDFDPKKKEHPETNPSQMEVQLLVSEISLVEPEPEPAAAPAPRAATSARRVATSAPAAAAPAAAPAAAGKKKVAVAAAAKPAKAVKEPKPPKEPAPPVDPDAVPELATESPEVLELVNGNDDLIGLARGLEESVAVGEFQLGGLLYHIRKGKLHHTMVDEDGKVIAAYAEKGGWQAFLTDNFNIGYRKGQWLQEIYQSFCLAGITNASEVVSSMGWTKAKTIAPYLTMEGAKVDEILELAGENTVDELQMALKETVTVPGAAAGTKTKMLTLKFRYKEGSAAAINGILNEGITVLGLKDHAEVLERIVIEWGAANAGGTAKVAQAPRQAAAAAPAKKVAAKKVAVAA